MCAKDPQRPLRTPIYKVIMLAAAAARVLFYPTLAYNVVMEKVSSRHWFNRIDDTVLLGALPFRSMTKELVEQEHVRGVVTMNEDYETQYFCNSATEWQSAGVEQLVLSTVDLTGVPSLADLHRGVEFTLRLREEGSSVYVHCKAGRSRSATMVAAYLIKLHRVSPEEACSRLFSIRPHILIRSAQMDMLRTFHQDVCGAQSH